MIRSTKMRSRVILSILFFGVEIFFLIHVTPASAIPAFARKYNVPCSLCHVAVPKLNDFGNTFRDNGYQMMTDADLPENHDEGFWPISLRTVVGYQNATIDNQPRSDGTGLARVTTRSAGFSGLDLLSFGTLGRNISYGIVYTPGLAGSGFSIGNTLDESDLEAAFVRFDHLLGTSLLNFKVGKFELDLPFSEHRTQTLNTPYVAYHYLSGVPYAVVLENRSIFPALTGTPGLTNQSGFALGDNQVGAELMGHHSDGIGLFRYTLSVLSNSRSDAFGGGRQAEFYGHVTQSLGEWGAVSGQRIGFFGFSGRTPTANETGVPGAGHLDRSFYRLGGDLSLNYAPFHTNLILTYIHGWEAGKLFCSDDGAGRCVPFPSARDAVWNGGFAELNYLATPKLIVVYRYDLIRNDRQIDRSLPNDFNDIDSHTAALRYAILVTTRAALLAHLEYNRTETRSVTQDPVTLQNRNVTASTALIGFDFAF